MPPTVPDPNRPGLAPATAADVRRCQALFPDLAVSGTDFFGAMGDVQLDNYLRGLVEPASITNPATGQIGMFYAQDYNRVLYRKLTGQRAVAAFSQLAMDKNCTHAVVIGGTHPDGHTVEDSIVVLSSYPADKLVRLAMLKQAQAAGPPPRHKVKTAQAVVEGVVYQNYVATHVAHTTLRTIDMRREDLQVPPFKLAAELGLETLTFGFMTGPSADVIKSRTKRPACVIVVGLTGTQFVVVLGTTAQLQRYVRSIYRVAESQEPESLAQRVQRRLPTGVTVSQAEVPQELISQKVYSSVVVSPAEDLLSQKAYIIYCFTANRSAAEVEAVMDKTAGSVARLILQEFNMLTHHNFVLLYLGAYRYQVAASPYDASGLVRRLTRVAHGIDR